MQLLMLHLSVSKNDKSHVMWYTILLQWNCIISGFSSSYDTRTITVEIWGRSNVIQAAFMDHWTL